MRCRFAWLCLCLSPILASPADTALAQNATTTVRKVTPATGAVPSPNVPYDAAAPEPGEPAQAPGEINPGAGDEGAGWDAAVEATPGPTPLIGEEQAAAVQRINAYFNGITNLQGTFDQIDSNNKHASGRFYVQRPGKLRFDYAPPSALRIVADGHFLAIEDSDLKTIEKYPLESTPFRLLLGEGVDLSRDARILGVERQEGALAITLQDKGGDAAGQIKLNFDTEPELKLKQWVIVDAQGLSTSVTINDIVPGRKVAADFFNAKVSFQPFE
jgi:outer membrane lipoprotein-sorting protein